MLNKILLTGFAIAFGALIVGSSIMCAVNSNQANTGSTQVKVL